MTLIEEDITSIRLVERRPSMPKRATTDESQIESAPTTATNTPALSRTNSNTHLAGSSTGVEFSLPPVDGGFNAWIVLISGFIIEGMVWGYPFSYSVYQQHYMKQPEFANASVTELAIVGTLSTAVAYIGGFLVGLLGGRFSLKSMMYAGSLLMVVGLLAASFSTQAWHLMLTQGFIFGLGGAFAYNSLMMFIPMYFFKYRGIATGVIFAGAGVFGLISPQLIDLSLRTIDWRWTLRIVALFCLVLCLGSSFIIRPRYSPDAAARNRGTLKLRDFSFITNKRFLVMAGAVLFQGIGFFVPNLFIQPYALYIGTTEQTSTIILSILNAASIFGQLALGHVCDRFGYTVSIIISSGVASLSVFFLWGFAGNSLAMLMSFVVVYGTFGSGFTSSFPSIVSDIAGTEHGKPILINGVFMLLRGIGNVVGNPIGSLILTSASRVSDAAGWQDMTYFVGSALLASTICGLIRRFMPTRSY